MDKVGRPYPRKDGFEKATGREVFVDDIKLTNMLYGFTFRSPLPHIKINRIDTKEAEKLEGVVKILTYKDIPGENIIPIVYNDYPALAQNRARFIGEAIALIAAESYEIAKKAAKFIKLDYTELRAVFDAKEAMKISAPKIYGKNNIFKDYIIKKGDIKKGFKESDIIIEREYRTNYQVHSYLEPQGMIADYQPDGRIIIYGSMQCPFYVQDAVARVLGISKNKVEVVQVSTGGGFGGKEDVPSIVAAHCALLSYHTKRPVKLIYTREEDFISMSKRHPSYVKVKYGAKRDGRIVACEVEYILDSGAYATLSPIVLWRGTVHAAGPYNIPNVLIKSYAVATNKVPCGAFRGFGQPQVSFAQESLIDELAYKLNISPLEIRKLNGLKKGDLTATSYKVKEEGVSPVLNVVVNSSKFESKWEKPDNKSGEIRKGIGLSITYYGMGLGAGGKHLSKSGVYVQIESDGSVRVAFGNTEIGQGAKTVLAQITAEALNAPYELIYIMNPNTSRVPDSVPTVASRTTFMSGNAIINACKPIYENILKCAAELLNCSEKEVISKNSYFYNKKGVKRISYKEVVKFAHSKRLKLSSEGWYIPPDTTFDKFGQGSAYYSYVFSANIAEVSVNIKTGEVLVDNLWVAHDIGKAINPQQAEGQIEGGAIQGMGYAIMENLVLDKGRILNPNFTGYIIPTAKDVPNIYPFIVENKEIEGPYGARGLGEPPLIGIAPAIANAIYNAIGIRIYETPILPEKILEAISSIKL